jgi:hypothetical protein
MPGRTPLLRRVLYPTNRNQARRRGTCESMSRYR